VSYRSRLLDSQHDVEAFDCTVESLNVWLRTCAQRAQQSDTARTYVWTETSTSSAVVAYFSITPTAVLRKELTGGLAGGISSNVPGYLLARLALDKTRHGQGLGTQLLVDAIKRMVEASERYGGRLIVVDAADQAAFAFYRRHDFIPIKDNPSRLVLKISTARRAAEA